MAAFLRLGLVEGPGKGREVGLAVSQYFHFRGGHFVRMSNAADNGANASMCASGDNVVAGWIVAPKQDAGKNGFKSGANGVDKGYLINGHDDVFAIRPDETFASMAASWIGYGMGIINSGATYALTQKAKYVKSTTASPLACIDVDVEQKILFVKIKRHQPA